MAGNSGGVVEKNSSILKIENATCEKQKLIRGKNISGISGEQKQIVSRM